MATVTKAFRDRLTWRCYAPGDEYAGDAAREVELAAMGLLSVARDDPPTDDGTVAADPPPDYWEMTNAALAALCAERGLAVPRRPTKAQLVALLEGPGRG